MSTFKEIRGQLIKKYTTNPTNPLEGQMWYNNTTGTLKVYRNVGATWVSGPSTNNTGIQRQAMGPQTANTSAVLAGGTGAGMSPPASWSADTETWDGTAWTVATSLTSGRRAFGSSSQTATASVVFGGYTGPWAGGGANLTEEWDGSSWTNSTNLATARVYLGGFGSQTSAVGAGGYIPGGARTEVEEYNGSTWTTGTALPVAEYGGNGLGVSETAGFIQYPTTASPTAVTKQYDGTSWTDAGTLNTVRNGAAMAGISTAALAYGGLSPPGANTDVTEEYDGSAWTTTPATLVTATVANCSGFGTSTSAIRAGATVPTPAATEEYSNPLITTQTVTTS